MKSLQDILVEIQALGPIAEDQFEAALAVAISDLQTVIASGVSPVSDPIVSIATTTQSGVVSQFVPKV